MTESIEFDHPEHFTVGTVGPKGHRTFFLQAGHAGRLVTLKIEKQQVGALAEYVAGLLADLPGPPERMPLVRTDLIDPVEPVFVVGALGVAWEEADQSLLLVAEELVDDDEEPGSRVPANARFRISRARAGAFVEHARSIVAAGRPPCRVCGRPADLQGVLCVACAN
jgi:uncharacterized repeat protein (TIGR03847 family)